MQKRIVLGVASLPFRRYYIDCFSNYMPEYGDSGYSSRKKREEINNQEELQRQREVLKQNQEIWEKMRAEKRAKKQVYSEVRKEVGAPLFASSGFAGCISIILILIGLITLIFNLILGLLILILGSLFFIAGSNQVNTQRRSIVEANKEASKRWRELNKEE